MAFHGMQKVIVIGCPGSGKSTFSRALHEATGLPLCHLDLLYWSAEGSPVPKTVFREQLYQELKKETWIIDGNYRSTMELRMQACDTVFFFDLTPEVCIDGIKSRKGKMRADMPCIMPEDDDEKFMETVKNYNTVNRPEVLELLSRYSAKNIIIFRSRNEADEYLSSIALRC